MADTPNISDAEWQVMKAVWDLEPVPASEVIEALKDQTEWSPRTIKTLLNRLVRKNAIDFTEENRRYLYRSRVTRRACVRRESRSFLRRVFDGDVTPALVHFLEDAELSSDEVR